MKRGVHLIGDLYGCQLENFAPTAETVAALEEKISKRINETGLHCLGYTSYFFGPGAVTSAFILAESHVAFHSWPEDGYVSIDVFTCNVAQKNDEKCEAVFNYLVEEIFQASEVNKQTIYR